MSIGNIQTVVICVPGTAGVQGACAAGEVQTVTTAYLVSPTASEQLDLLATPIDPAQLGEVWMFGFVATLSIWLLSISAGSVIRMVKSV